MGRKKREQTEEENPAMALLAQAEVVEEDKQEGVDPGKEAEEKDPPNSTSPEWQEYVMSHFTKEEMFDNRPTASGLMRVVELLVGEIVESNSYSIKDPSPANDFSATARHEIVIIPHHQRRELRYSGIADCMRCNTEPEFFRFPSCMASTRAKARALRDALKLKVAAAEEMTKLPIEDETAKIKPAQINFLDILSKKNNINTMKFINLGKNKYKSIEEVPYVSAAKMVQVLSQYQQDQTKIPQDILGYDENWRTANANGN